MVPAVLKLFLVHSFLGMKVPAPGTSGSPYPKPMMFCGKRLREVPADAARMEFSLLWEAAVGWEALGKGLYATEPLFPTVDANTMAVRSRGGDMLCCTAPGLRGTVGLGAGEGRMYGLLERGCLKRSVLARETTALVGRCVVEVGRSVAVALVVRVGVLLVARDVERAVAGRIVVARLVIVVDAVAVAARGTRGAGMAKSLLNLSEVLVLVSEGRLFVLAEVGRIGLGAVTAAERLLAAEFDRDMSGLGRDSTERAADSPRMEASVGRPDAATRTVSMSHAVVTAMASFVVLALSSGMSIVSSSPTGAYDIFVWGPLLAASAALLGEAFTGEAGACRSSRERRLREGEFEAVVSESTSRELSTGF